MARHVATAASSAPARALRASPVARPAPAALTLRDMCAQDVEQVAAIEARAYSYPWGEGIFRDCLRAGYRCRVMVDQGEVVGYAIMSVAAGEAHLLNLCIEPARQRAGVGRRLLGDLLAAAHKCNAAILFLEVRPTNTAALALYGRYGFERIGVRRRYYRASSGREDALILAFNLASSLSIAEVLSAPP